MVFAVQFQSDISSCIPKFHLFVLFRFGKMASIYGPFASNPTGVLPPAVNSVLENVDEMLGGSLTQLLSMAHPQPEGSGGCNGKVHTSSRLSL